MCRICRTLFAAVAVVVVASPVTGQTTRPAVRIVAGPTLIRADGDRPAAVTATVISSTDSPAPTPATAADVRAAVAATAAEQAWPRTVEALARALTDGDRAALESLLTARAKVRHFGTSTAEEPGKVAERLAKSILVGHHGYVHPPMVMAADVATDFKVATAVPDKAKVKFVIDDQDEIKRANATAVQWVVEQLAATPGTQVGIIVLWSARPGGAAGTDPVFEPVFVLCRGEETGTGAYRLTNVVYGNPLPEEK